jgi:hypothetical protein
MFPKARLHPTTEEVRPVDPAFASYWKRIETEQAFLFGFQLLCFGQRIPFLPPSHAAPRRAHEEAAENRVWPVLKIRFQHNSFERFRPEYGCRRDVLPKRNSWHRKPPIGLDPLRRRVLEVMTYHPSLPNR